MSDNYSLLDQKEVKKCLACMPLQITILPLRNKVAFPGTVMSVSVNIPRSMQLVEEACKQNWPLGLVALKNAYIEEPGPEQVYDIGTVGVIQRIFPISDQSIQLIIQGLERFKVTVWTNLKPYLQAKVILKPDTLSKDGEIQAMVKALRDIVRDMVELVPQFSDGFVQFIEHVQEPRSLVYLIAQVAQFDVNGAQKILELDKVKDKLLTLISLLTQQKELLYLGQKIKKEAQEEIGKDQKDYFLRQQMRAIQKELGEDNGNSIIEKYQEKIEQSGMSDEAKTEALKELRRLKGMSAHSAEYSVIATYLDWLVELPWTVLSQDQLDINQAREILDQDHYDLDTVKDRIVEFLAVRKLIKDRGLENILEQEQNKKEIGTILCFVGPPGVGKTSLGQSIARALGRQFTRMSLGGMRDEAEIRGHRRTYIGAMPGRIIQAIKRTGTRNPVFMLDEVDKIGKDWRGDPSSALLEVLDPAQNQSFRDHYLDVDFDLSQVIFITTANQLETIPAPLLDRMETINLEGYTEQEKLFIARKYLVPRQIWATGLIENEVEISTDGLLSIIRNYTREAGVRELERRIGSICRKCAVRIASGDESRLEITSTNLEYFLKRELFQSNVSEKIDIPGIATGLAVTAVGGEILYVEATRTSGKGELTITGHLGEVMSESAKIAYTYVRSKALELGIDPQITSQSDLHIHIPAGAVPKDGPSAGLPMVMALASLFSGRTVRSDMGITGEITLRGRVLPVGGIKAKVLAAHRSGLKAVMMPKKNQPDLKDLPEEVLKSMDFVCIERIDQALDLGLQPAFNTNQVEPVADKEDINHKMEVLFP